MFAEVSVKLKDEKNLILLLAILHYAEQIHFIIERLFKLYALSK